MKSHEKSAVYRKASFFISAQKFSQCPDDTGLEVAFAGRSNAGKSSAINKITNNKNLARISKTPGRTQLINFFTLDEQRRLVDLPGYGYAKVPVAVKRQWEQQLSLYLEQRQSLQGLILLMDIRHPLKEFDLQMLSWCAAARMPVHVLLTKADKLKRSATSRTLLEVRKKLEAEFEHISVQTFSASTGEGLEQLYEQLGHWLEPQKKEAPEPVGSGDGGSGA